MESLRLPREVTNIPGPLDLSRQPYLTEILESVLNPEISEVVEVFGTQTGKTLSLMLALALLATFDPAPAIIALPNEDLADEIIRSRVLPFFRANPQLSRMLPESERAIAKGKIPLSTMPVYWLGALVPAKLSSRPVGYLILDEAAKYKHLYRDEAPPVALLKERQKTFARRLTLQASTPSVEENDFWQSFLNSDQRHFYVPCPHCGEFQKLVFSRESLIWEGNDVESVTESARYVCQFCHGEIRDEHKSGMMSAGEWRPENPLASPSVRGYHLNSLYSPFVTFGQFAAEFFRSQSALLSAGHLQNFENSWNALPWRKYSLAQTEKQVRELISPLYRRGQILRRDYRYIFVGYDPGETATHWVAVAMCDFGEMFVIDWGTLASYSTDELRRINGPAVHFRSLVWEDGIRPDIGYIDSGTFTQKIYEEAARSRGALTPTKGRDVSFGTWGTTQIRSFARLHLLSYVDATAKDELYGEIIQKNTGSLHLPLDADQPLIAGLSGQKLIRAGGRLAWAKIENDHFGDCIKLARVSWWVNQDNPQNLTP